MSFEFIINMPEINSYAVIYRNYVPEKMTKDLFKLFNEECTERLNTTSNKKTVHLQTRTNCFYANAEISEIKHSSVINKPQPWNYVVWKLRMGIMSDIFKPNACIVDGFITEEDKTTKHRDVNLNDINNTLCNVSIGGTRRMILRSYESEKCSVERPKMIEVELHNGDVLFIYGNANKYFTNEISPFRKKENFDFHARYSLTFYHI